MLAVLAGDVAAARAGAVAEAVAEAVAAVKVGLAPPVVGFPGVQRVLETP